MVQAEDIINTLESLANEEKRKVLMKFFKTGQGEYGENDQFLGIPVPTTRSVVKECGVVTLETIDSLLCSPFHEVRFCALQLLVVRYMKKKEERENIFNFYLSHTDDINNWDLVDLSAPNIVGHYLLTAPRDVLYKLAESSSLWERRIAIVSTLMLIRKNQFDDTLKISALLLGDKESLLHKAVGWMLREVGKRNEQLLLDFLDNNIRKMARTSLRYAIEKLSPELRNYYMQL